MIVPLHVCSIGLNNSIVLWLGLRSNTIYSSQCHLSSRYLKRVSIQGQSLPSQFYVMTGIQGLRVRPWNSIHTAGDGIFRVLEAHQGSPQSAAHCLDHFGTSDIMPFTILGGR